MQAYSFRKNLAYMNIAFFSPPRLVRGFLHETSLLYGIVPLAISEALYGFFGWWVYFTRPQLGWSHNPFAQAFHLSRRQMSLIQAAAHPLVGLADIFLFAGLIYMTARLLRAGGISVRMVLTFFMFLWGTFSCLAFLVDLAMFCPPFGWDLKNLMYIHPLVGMVSIVYLLEFIHRQAALERWKSALIVFCGYFIILASRVVFIP